MTTARLSVSAVVVAVLSACGGGGGGGGGGGAVEVPFSSFAAVAPNQTVVMDARTVTANVQSSGPPGSVTVNSMNFTPESAGTVRLSYDGSRALSGISITSPQPNSSVSFNAGTPGHSISCSGGTCLAESLTASAVVIDAFALGWNYQSFGVWGLDTSSTTSVFGAASAGNVTSGTALPTTGSFTFNGLTAGFYVDPSGIPFATASTMTAGVNFGSRNITFATSDMQLVNVNTGGTSTRSDLALNGTLTYSAGVNAFSGTVTNTLGLSGTASGRFYGPAAEEMGGIYNLSQSGSATHRMVGGFGAKR